MEEAYHTKKIRTCVSIQDVLFGRCHRKYKQRKRVGGQVGGKRSTRLVVKIDMCVLGFEGLQKLPQTEAIQSKTVRFYSDVHRRGFDLSHL